MASDGDRQDPKKPERHSIWEADEAGWAEAIDEWDQLLDLPDLGVKEETAGAKGSPVSAPGPTAAPTMEAVAGDAVYRDPLVDFVTTEGEMEIDDGAGEALGSLLGSDEIDEQRVSTRGSTSSSLGTDLLDDIGLNPEIVQTADLEIEMNASTSRSAADSGWNHALTPVSFQDERPISMTAELPDQDKLEEEETQVRTDISDFEETQVKEVSDFEETRVRTDISDFEETQVRQKGQVADTAFPRAIEPPSTIEALPPISDLTPLPRTIADLTPLPLTNDSQAAQASPLPLPSVEDLPESPLPDLFDELIPPTPDDDPLDIDELVIEAGEVLPRPEYDDATPSGSLLPVEPSADLSDEEDLQPPPLPENLTRLDLSSLSLLDIDPPATPAREDLEHLCNQLQLEANLTDSSTHAAELEFCAASILVELGEADEAIDHFREVLNHRPGHIPAMRALRRAYTSRNEPDQVAELTKQMIPRVGPEEKDALLTTCVDLLWSQTGDDSGAQALLEDLATRKPENLRGLLSRADLAAAMGNDGDLCTVIQALADLIQGSQLESSLHLEVGHFKELSNQLDEAISCYQKALSYDENCHSAREGLIRLASARRDVSLLADVLVDETRSNNSSLWIARRLRRRAILTSLPPAGARDCVSDLQRAHELCPDDLLIHEEIAEAQKGEKNYLEAIRLYSLMSQQVEDPEQKKLALVEAAMIAEHELNDRQSAEELYRKAADLDQDYPPIQNGLNRLRLADNSPETRIAAHCETAIATVGHLRASHHYHAAMLWVNTLGNREKATEELHASLEHWPSNRIALLRLEQLYRESGEFEQLAATLDTAAEATDDAREAENLRDRTALIYEGPLRNPEVALKRYNQILESVPNRTYALLGKLRNLSAIGRNDDFAATLSLFASTIEDDQLAARMWTSCGYRLWAVEKLGESEAAFRSALIRIPTDQSATWGLIIALSAQHRWDESIECWSTLVSSLPESSPQRNTIWLRMAAIYEVQLKDLDQAARLYRLVAEHPTPPPGAVTGLLRVLHQCPGADKQAEYLQRALEAARDPAERFAVLVTAGELAQKNGAPWEEAAAIFKLALDEMPGHPMARQSYEILLSSQGERREISDLLLSDLAAENDTGHRIATYQRLATLDLHRGDSQSARHSLNSILDLQPDHLPALRALQAFHITTRDWPALFERMGQEAEYSTSPAARASLWLDLARRLTYFIQAPESNGEGEIDLPQRKSTDAFQRALENHPTSILALRNLLDLATLAEDKEQMGALYLRLADEMDRNTESCIFLSRAGELLLEDNFTSFLEALERCPTNFGAIYQIRDRALSLGDWSNAALAAEAEGKTSKVKEHRAFAFLIAGEIAREHLRNPGRAITAYQNSLKADPYNWTAFQQLDLFLEDAGRWEELAELLAARSEVEHSHKKLIQLHHKLALIARERLQDHPRAKRHLRLLLSLQGEHLEALTLLADLYTADAEWEEAADALIRIARLERDPIKLRDLFLRLGRIYQEENPDHRRAIACLNKVLTLDPNHLEALSRLSTLYTISQDYNRAVTTTTQLLERETDEEQKIEHLIHIAKIHEDGFKNPHNAALAFRQALEYAPDNLKAISELCGFFARQSDQRSLMIHLDRSVATMRARIVQDPFETFAYRALFKIFRWRKAPDGCLCAAQVLEALGQSNAEEQEFLDNHRAAVGSADSAIGAVEHDDWLFHRSIPSGFRQIFRTLADPFAKIFPGDIKSHGVTRSDRITNADHPCRRVGDALARDFGVQQYQLFFLEKNRTALIVEKEKSDPPAILIGKALIEDSTEEELMFLMGRCLWTISKGMVLPSRLTPRDLEIFISGIIRKYSPDFHPPEMELNQLKIITKQVEKAIPRKLNQELMPYVLECSGPRVDLRIISESVIHSANRAGLLSCRSPYAAISVLRKISGKLELPRTPEERVLFLRNNLEAEELMRFAVSDSYFELRRAMQISIR